MLAEKSLAKKTLVATVMSNAGLEAAIKTAGGKMLRTAVGDKNVIDEMLTKRLQLRRRAKRPSDFPRLRHHRRRPGGGAANLADYQGKEINRLSRLAQCWTRFPQLVTNVKVREKKPFEQLDGLSRLVAEAEKELPRKADGCCCVIPARNPRCACWWKAATRRSLEKWSKKICGAIQKQIGA